MVNKIAKYSQTIFSLTTFLVCISIIVALQKPLLKEVKQVNINDLQRQEKLNESKLKIISKINKINLFNFENLIADWLFLNFIQYNGDVQARNANGYNLLPNYYELIVKQDPRFVESYFFLDPSTSLFAGRPDISVELMSYGLKFIRPEQSKAYQVWLFKATNQLLFLGNSQEAKISFEQASEWAKIENTEQSLQTAEFLENNPDSRKARASSWLMVLNNAREDEVKQIALNNLRKLGASIVIEGNIISVKIPEDFED